MIENAIYSTIDLPTEPQYENYTRRQQKVFSRFPFACHLAIALGFLNVVLMCLLLFRCIPRQDSQHCVSCPDLWMKYGNHCYYFSVKEMNWTSSREFCIAQNSSLLVLTDKEMADNHLFKDFFNEHFYWIGLRNNSGWKWEDGTIPNNLRIVSNSLVQKCGTINKGDLLQASSCEVNLRWVCRRLLSVR